MLTEVIQTEKSLRLIFDSIQGANSQNEYREDKSFLSLEFRS